MQYKIQLSVFSFCSGPCPLLQRQHQIKLFFCVSRNFLHLCVSPFLIPTHTPIYTPSQEHAKHFFHIRIYFGRSSHICIYRFSLFSLMTVSFPLYKSHNLLSALYGGNATLFSFFCCSIAANVHAIIFVYCGITILGLI